MVVLKVNLLERAGDGEPPQPHARGEHEREVRQGIGLTRGGESVIQC
jgi:hypothetical protein